MTLHEVNPALAAVGVLARITLRQGKFNLYLGGTFAGTVKLLKRLKGYDGFGIQDGGDAQALLTDSGAFANVVADQLIDLWAANRTDGSFAPITGNGTTTVTGALIAGTDNAWDDGDVADIYQEIDSFTADQDAEFEAYSNDTEYVLLVSAYTSGTVNSEFNQ